MNVISNKLTAFADTLGGVLPHTRHKIVKYVPKVGSDTEPY